MNEKIYYYSKQKLVGRTVVAIAIFGICSNLVIGVISSGQIRGIGLLILLSILALGAAAYLILAIPVFLSKAKIEIELNEKGIYSKGNNGEKIGKIPWDNIRQISRQRIENKDYVCVHVRDITPFIGRITAPEKRAMLISSNIALVIDNSDVKDDLTAILSEANLFLNIYGAPDHEHHSNYNSHTTQNQNSTVFNDLKISVLDVEVFMHYDSGLQRKKNFEDANWMHEHVFFWPMLKQPDVNSLPSGFEKYNIRYFIFTKPLPAQLKVSKALSTSDNQEKFCFTLNGKPYSFDILLKSGNLTYITLIKKHNHVFSNLKNIYASKTKNNTLTPEKQITLQTALSDDDIYLFQLGK